MKIRATGTPEQIEILLEQIPLIVGTQCNYISKPYKQTRKCKTSKYVSVYLDFEDDELHD